MPENILKSTFKRRSRYIKCNPPAMNIWQAGRYFAILEYLISYKYLLKAHILTLLNAYNFPTSEVKLKQILLKLFHNGYVNRKYELRPMGTGSSPAIYIIAKKGINVLATKEGKFIDDFSYSNKVKSVVYENLAHNIMISHVLVCFITGAIKAGWRVIGFVHDTLKYRQKVSFPLFPDGIIILEKPDGTRHNFFLECDRNTTKRLIFKRKLYKYAEWIKNGGYKDLLMYFYNNELGIDDVYEDNLRNIRILTIANSQARMRVLVQEAYNIGKNGHGAFLFSSIDKFRLECPETVLMDNFWICGYKG